MDTLGMDYDTLWTHKDFHAGSRRNRLSSRAFMGSHMWKCSFYSRSISQAPCMMWHSFKITQLSPIQWFMRMTMTLDSNALCWMILQVVQDSFPLRNLYVLLLLWIQMTTASIATLWMTLWITICISNSTNSDHSWLCPCAKPSRYLAFPTSNGVTQLSHQFTLLIYLKPCGSLADWWRWYVPD